MTQPETMTVYRIVATNPPTRDMQSYAALGRKLRDTTPEAMRLAQGISVFATAARAPARKPFPSGRNGTNSPPTFSRRDRAVPPYWSDQSCEREGMNDVPRTHYDEDKDRLKLRLRKIEGQVRGLQQMIDDDRYCLDVVQQVNALTAAAREVAVLVMESHLRATITEAVQSHDGERAIQEMVNVLRRALRTERL